MISIQRQCVFVHIPKTAGTSICTALEQIRDRSVNEPFHDHRTIQELRAVLSPSDFTSYFKFTFVRNPWDRVVSWYKNLMEDPMQAQRFGVVTGCSLHTFLTDCGNIWGLQSQLHWIRDADGSIPVDFVGRFENLIADYAKVCRAIGVTEDRLVQRAGAEDRRPYTAFYDDKTRRLVGDRYAEEIELLQYRFGG